METLGLSVGIYGVPVLQGSHPLGHADKRINDGKVYLWWLHCPFTSRRRLLQHQASLLLYLDRCSSCKRASFSCLRERCKHTEERGTLCPELRGAHGLREEPEQDADNSPRSAPGQGCAELENTAAVQREGRGVMASSSLQGGEADRRVATPCESLHCQVVRRQEDSTEFVWRKKVPIG